MNELCKCGHGAESHLRYHGPCQGLMIGGTDMAPNRSCSCGEFENSELSTLRTALACAEEQIKEAEQDLTFWKQRFQEVATQWNAKTSELAEKDKEIERLKDERDDLQAAFNKGFEMHRAAEAKIAELEARCAAQEKR